MVPSAFETWVNETRRVRGVEQLLVLLEDDLAAVVDRGDAQHGALLGSRAAATARCWRGARAMRDDDLVARADVAAAPALRDEVDALGRAAHEDDLLGATAR